MRKKLMDFLIIQRYKKMNVGARVFSGKCETKNMNKEGKGKS